MPSALNIMAVNAGSNRSVHHVSVMVVAFLAIAVLCVVLLLEKIHAQQSTTARLVQQPDLVLGIGHSMKVNAVALGLDDRLLASASADNTIGLWDVPSGRELRALSGHKGWVKCVRFSPDGRLLASGSNDKTIKIWDVARGNEIHTLEGHTAPVESIAFSADGHLLASGSADNSAKLWDLTTARESNTLRGHSGWVTAVAFSGDGNWLATGSKDTTVRLWEVATGREARVLKGHVDRINAVTFSPNAEWIASASSDGTIKIWKTESGQETRSLSSAAGAEIAVAFSGDGQSVMSVTSNRTVKVWNIGTGREVRTAGNPASLDFVESVAFAADTQSFISSADKSVELYDSTSAKKIRSFDSRAAGFYALAFSANARWFASAGKDKTIRLWDTMTGRQLPALVGHTGYVTSLVFSKDGGWLASGSIDQTIRVWDTSTGRETRKLTGHDEAVNSLALSPDNQWLASGGYDKSIRIWNPQSGEEIHRLSGHTGEVTAIAFSADGKWLASASVDKTIRVWSTTTWAESRVLTATSPVTAIVFSPDSKWLAASGNDVTFKLFDVATWRETGAVPGTSSQVHALAFSPDGRWLATASADGAVRIWDPASAAPLHVLTGHSDSVNTVAFSADGKWLLSSGEDASILLWEATSGQKTATLAALRESDDWLVVTPDGLFDGSPTAWSQILWRFGGNTFNHLPVEVFFSEFYYPGLLAEILNGKRPHAPLDISRKDRRQPQIDLKLAASVNENEVTARTVSIKINVTEARTGDQKEGSGVRDVRLFRNASLVKAWRGDVQLNADGGAVLEAQVPIVAGKNVITAYAFNRDNIKSADAELSLVGSKELKRGGTAYIFVAGVNQYANSSFNLRYAVADAGDFGEELQRAQMRIGNFTDIQVIPLLDRAVTKANFIYGLQRLSQGEGAAAPVGVPDILKKLKTAQPEDAVVIYFAGHGVATPDGRFYLIPHDLGYDGPRTQLDGTSLRNILDHSISDRELEQALENIDAGQLLLVIDACNSGQALESEEKRRGPMNSKGLAQLAYEKGMYVLTAAQSYQAALEQRRLGHGYLTYALVEEGLKTPAADARPKDGQVELSEWLDYAVARVPLMQAGTAKDAQGRILEQEDDSKKKTRDVQRPRVFYRSNAEARQMIIARP